MSQTELCRQLHSEILRLRGERKKLKEVAQIIGVSKNILNFYCCEHGIKFRQKTEEEWAEIDQRIRLLLEDGCTRREIEELLGPDGGNVHRRMKLMGLSSGRTGPRSGSDHPEWKGGRTVDKHGYVYVHVPMHPNANHQGRVFEHRLVMEVVIGRYLTEQEVVDHGDDHPRHNWPKNLTLYASNGDHLRNELSGQSSATSKGGARPTPRKSIPGAYGNNQRLSHCPDESETLAQCPSEIRKRLAYYIESFRPKIEHRSLNRRQLREAGAWRDPFLQQSTD